MLGCRVACLALASFVAAGPAAATELAADPTVHHERITIVLKDGTTYQARAYQRRFELAALAFAEGSTRRFVSVSDIEAIVDSTGTNVAPRLLRMRYRPVGLESAAMKDFIQARSISLRSGEEIRGVRFLMNTNRRELLVLDGASPRAISWDDIERIQGRDGKEHRVAGLVAPDSMPGASPPSLASERSLLPWRFALDLRGDFDAAGGKYYSGTTGGAGLGVCVHAALSDEAALRFDVQMLGLGFDESFGLVSVDPAVTILSQEYDMDALRVGVGAEYHAPLDRWSPRRGFWFLQTSFGVIRHALRGEVTIQSGAEIATAEASTTESGWALTVGAGVIRIVHSFLGLSLSGDVGLLLKDPLGIVTGLYVGMALVD